MGGSSRTLGAPRPAHIRARSSRRTLPRAFTLSLIVAAGSACNEEAHFHFLRPPPASTGGSGGAPPAGGGGGMGPGGQDNLGGFGERAPSLLVHRYDFEGEGTVAVDRIGDRDGEILGGAELTGAGHVVLDGEDDYVALPSRLVSHLPAVTLAAWLTWEGNPARCWQRIFDFGNNDAEVPGDAGQATSSVFVTPANCGSAAQDPPNVLTGALEVSGSSQWVRTSFALPVGEPVFVALVFSDAEERFELYLDGDLVAGDAVRPAVALAELDDTNAWLGRSQWIQDQVTFLRARYDEFRVYGGALSPAELRDLAQRGPDAP